jgi:diguanylate cyclase (GGDEF)-like protein/PAS domain S-box-containing protein
MTMFSSDLSINIEDALRQREEQLRFVLEGSELGFWDWNIETQSVKRNERWAIMLGYTYEEIQQTTQQWTDFIYPDDRERAWASIKDVLEGRSLIHKIEYRMLHKDGGYRWILDQAKVMQRDNNGNPIRMCGTHTDVTDRKNMELELERQAHIDYLTGINNRRHFMMLANNELRRDKRHHHELSLLMFDVDHFKAINDQYGHQVGDLVLQKLVIECRGHLRTEDIFGRIGGEEFAVLLPETEIKAAIEVAERLRMVTTNTFLVLENGKSLHVTISVGVTSCSCIDDIDLLLSQADKALYNAKNSGRDKVCIWNE